MKIDRDGVPHITILSSALILSLASQKGWAQDEKPRPAETLLVPVVTAPSVEENKVELSPAPAPAPNPQVKEKEKEKEKGKNQSANFPKLTPEQIAALPARDSAWSIGFDARQLNVTPNDRRYKQRSTAPDINVGYVHIDESWWVMARGHLPFGPTSQRYPDSPPLDFEGYGISTTYGHSFSGHLRDPSGDYGAEIGLEVFELVGRSFRRQVLPDNSVSNAWVMKTRWTALTPALTATFLKPSRPQGSRPEWLMTRIEGYRLSAGIVIPVQNSWDLRWEHNGVGQGDRGNWKGFFGVASLTAWLGI